MYMLVCGNYISPLRSLQSRPLARYKKEKPQRFLSGTRNRGRTGTGITAHRILSPACLPIPPSEPHNIRKDGAKVRFYFHFTKHYPSELINYPYNLIKERMTYRSIRIRNSAFGTSQPDILSGVIRFSSDTKFNF